MNYKDKILYDFAECEILNTCKCTECEKLIYPGMLAICNIDVEEDEEVIFHKECFDGDYIEG